MLFAVHTSPVYGRFWAVSPDNGHRSLEAAIQQAGERAARSGRTHYVHQMLRDGEGRWVLARVVTPKGAVGWFDPISGRVFPERDPKTGRSTHPERNIFLNPTPQGVKALRKLQKAWERDNRVKTG